MQIETFPEATFTFKASDYFLVSKGGEWSLNPRIDRSEKGKSDDIGSPTIMLTEMEAQALFKSGFSKVEL